MLSRALVSVLTKVCKPMTLAMLGAKSMLICLTRARKQNFRKKPQAITKLSPGACQRKE